MIRKGRGRAFQLTPLNVFRYWNQCMSAAGNSTDVSPNRSSDASPSFEAQEFKIEVSYIFSYMENHFN